MNCLRSIKERAFMYYSRWHTDTLCCLSRGSVMQVSELLATLIPMIIPNDLPDWCMRGSLPSRYRGNPAVSLRTWDISHSSLQCMGHCSLQIAHCVMPGPLPTLKAVIKLFPPLQEAMLCVSHALLVVNIQRNQKVMTLTATFILWQANGGIACHIFSSSDWEINESTACVLRAFNVTLSAAQCH